MPSGSRRKVRIVVLGVAMLVSWSAVASPDSASSEAAPDATATAAASASVDAEAAERAVRQAESAAKERLPLGAGEAPLVGEAGRAAHEAAESSKGGWLLRTIGALGLVIFLMFALKWGMGKASGMSGTLRSQLGAAGRSPSGVLFVLGRYPVARGLSLVLVRLDSRVMLLSQSSEGFRTLTEITSADEVASIIRKAEGESGSSAAAQFAKVIKAFERDPSVTAEPMRLKSESASSSDAESMTDGRVIVERKSSERSNGMGRVEHRRHRTDLEG